MSIEFIYREAILGDVEALNRLGRIAYSQYVAELDTENWLKLEELLNDKSGTENLLLHSKTFVCENAGEIIGMIYYVPSQNPAEESNN